MLKYNQFEEKYNPDYIAALDGKTGIAPMKEYKALFNPYHAALLESLDDGVGRITRQLKDLGLDENTLIVFTSDNGGVGLPELGPIPTNSAPLRKWKGFMYEGGSRVPLIVKWPGKIKEEVVNDNYITGTDYLPTFMEILGVKDLPAEMDGKSFLKTLYHPAEHFDRGPIYWHYPHFSNQGSRPAGAVRNGDYKLVENFETGQLELYNIKEDIGEKEDLSAAEPQRTGELAQLLKEWRESIGANMPVPNPDYKKRNPSMVNRAGSSANE